MRLFYSSRQINNHFELSGDEFRHIVKVLRHKRGDNIQVIDGTGHTYDCQITQIEKDLVTAVILTKNEITLLPYHLTIAIALTKKSARFEWFLEKAVEIGIHEIVLLRTHRSEKLRVNEERMQKIMISAMKQSGNTWLPTVKPLTDFKDFVSKSFPDSRKFIACVEENTTTLSSKAKAVSALIAIGPEGGFTSDEIELAKNADFQPVSLGNSRLRTETAGVVACQIIKTINEILV